MSTKKKQNTVLNNSNDLIRFDNWNEQKKEIELKDQTGRLCYPGDVIWCNLGKNVGFEQDGKHKNFTRPVLILKRLSPDTIFVVPLTTSDHQHKLRVPLNDFGGKGQSKAIVSQIKVIDVRRLQEKIGEINGESLAAVRKAIRGFL